MNFSYRWEDKVIAKILIHMYNNIIYACLEGRQREFSALKLKQALVSVILLLRSKRDMRESNKYAHYFMIIQWSNKEYTDD